MTSEIRLSKCYLDDQEYNQVKLALDSSFLGMGSIVFEFEQLLTSYLGQTVIATSSGTSALHLALEALDIGEGDEVIIPSLTYLASFQAVSATGAKPVACDVTANGQICLDSMISKITNKTKAVMPVHYAFNTFSYNELYQVCRSHRLRVIEDAAHAFGSVNAETNSLVGGYGDIVCFSFDGIKNITCGEGGCIVTSDEEVITRTKTQRLLGVEGDSIRRYEGSRSWLPTVQRQGWRYHMNNIHASIGISQFHKLSKFRVYRNSLCSYYESQFRSTSTELITLIDRSTAHVPHIFPILISSNVNRQVLRSDLLTSYKIQTGLHYAPNHLLDYYLDDTVLPNSEYFGSHELTLPLHMGLTFSDIDYIVSSVLESMKKQLN